MREPRHQRTRDAAFSYLVEIPQDEMDETVRIHCEGLTIMVDEILQSLTCSSVLAGSMSEIAI